jgi:hypothetical protein
MPIEIKELHIRVSINTPPREQQPREQSSGPESGTAGSPRNRDALVAECVERVFEIIQNKGER